jgi:hypothetical protein
MIKPSMLALAVMGLLACGGSPAPAPTPPTPPAPPAEAEPAFDLAQLGAPCGEEAKCIAPTTCERYYGIAGPNGPAFFSCELPCDGAAKACPEGARCVTIADGPGQVCRPIEPQDHPPNTVRD